MYCGSFMLTPASFRQKRLGKKVEENETLIIFIFNDHWQNKQSI